MFFRKNIEFKLLLEKANDLYDEVIEHDKRDRYGDIIPEKALQIYNDILSIYNEALVLKADSQEVLLLKAKILIDMGKPDDGLEIANLILLKNENHIQALDVIARYYELTKDSKSLKSTCKKISESKIKNRKDKIIKIMAIETLEDEEYFDALNSSQ